MVQTKRLTFRITRNDCNLRQLQFKKYDIGSICDCEKLINILWNNDKENDKMYVFPEELFGNLEKAHGQQCRQ